MRNTAWALTAAMAWCAGCASAPEATTLPAAPVKQPTTAAAGAPLPAKALEPLSALKPAIVRPTNTPGANFLGEKIRKDVEAAEADINAHRYAQALPALQQAVRIEPRNPRVQRALGLAYAGLGTTGKAREHLIAGIVDAPDDLTAQLILGRLAMAEHKYDEAAGFLRTALVCTAAAPEEARTAEALLLLGRVLEEQGRYQGALDCYERFAAWADLHGRNYASRPLLKALILNSEKILALRGGTLLSLRRYNEAVTLLEAAYRRNRTDTGSATLLLKALVMAGRLGQAEKLLLSMSAEPAQQRTVPALAQLLCVASGDRAMPRRIWEALGKGQAALADTLAPALAQSARSMEDYAQGRGILESALKSRPGSPAAARMLADLLVRDRKWGEALVALAGALAANPAGAAQVDAGIADVARGGRGEDPSVQPRPLPADFEKTFAQAALNSTGPAQPALCYVAGQLALRRGQRDLARECLTKALATDARFLPAYEALANLHLAARQFDQADRLVIDLRKLDPSGYFVEYLSGKIAMERGWTHSAITPLALALQRSPRHRATMVLLARAYDAVGRHSDADSLAEQALDLEPDDLAFGQWFFDRLLANKQYRRAGALAETVSAQRPGLPDGPLMQAEVLLRQGNVAQARSMLDNLASRAGPTFRSRLLDVEIRMGQPEWMLPKDIFDRAVSELSQALVNPPDDQRVAQARLLLARLLSRSGQHARALDAWGPLQARQKLTGPDAQLYVASLVAAGKGDEAVKILTEQVLNDAADTASRNLLLDSLLKLNRADTAVRLATTWQERAAAERDPTAPAALARALVVCRTAKQYAPAIAILDKRIEDEEDEDRLGVLRGAKIEFLHLAGKDDEVARLADPWIGAKPMRPLSVLATVEALAETKLFAPALASLDKALAGYPPRPATPAVEPSLAGMEVRVLRTCKGLIYSAAKDAAAGEPFCLEWAKDPAQRVTARQVLVDILMAAEQYEKVGAYLAAWMKETAVPAPGPTEEDSDGPGVFQKYCRRESVVVLREMARQAEAKGDEAVRTAKLAEAARKAEAYLQAAPGEWDLLFELSILRMELGQPEAAAKALEKAYEICKGLQESQPGMTARVRLLQNNLGYQYADMGIKLEEAERYIRQALLERQPIHVQDSLGWVLYKQGRLREAGALFGEVIRTIRPETQEQSPVIYDHAGDVYYRLGWKELARAHWTRAVEAAAQDKKPSFEVRHCVASVQKKLQALRAGGPVPVAPLGKGVKE